MRVEPIRDKELIGRTAEALRRDGSEAGNRRYLMFLIGIYLGRRVSDYRMMKVGDLLGRDKLVIREQKTGKQMELFIPRTLQKALRERLSGRAPEEWLFLSPQRDRITGDPKPVCYRTLLRDSKEVMRIMGLPEGYNIGTHSWRKTFGYWYYKTTQDIAGLMKLFNHTKEETTLIYIGIASDEMRQTFRKVDKMYDL